ncbi:hypothetical protein GCM10009744_01980 [Kribbella alba]|uniref:Uncharacterized protein n=1 Tax=Kribbella alba TaxID=190197 RepID=A0ABP4QQM3_9ACTN
MVAARRLHSGGPGVPTDRKSSPPRPANPRHAACTIGRITGSGDYYLFVGTGPAPRHAADMYGARAAVAAAVSVAVSVAVRVTSRS